MIRIRSRGFKAPFVLAVVAALLAACEPAGQGDRKSTDRVDSAEAGYLPPPSLESVQRAGARLWCGQGRGLGAASRVRTY